MSDPSALAVQIEAALGEWAGCKPHPSGHSNKLLRYKTLSGIPFAIGRTSENGVRFWIQADDRFKASIEANGFSCARSAPKPARPTSRATGRNSNLDQIPQFKGASLYWTKVRTPGEALAVARSLT